MNKKNLLLGAHVSIQGGFEKAIDRAEKIGANCIQIFTKSNRQWRSKEITDQESQLFIDRKKKSTVKIVAAHASYLINLGSKSNETIQKSIIALAEELQRCEQLHIPYLILHPGTARFEEEQQSLQFLATNIDIALKQSKTKKVMLLLETMAGQGSMLGYKFKQLATIIDHIKQKKRVGVCFDTCHAFAAGYRFDTPEQYKLMWQQFNKSIGIKNIKIFHLNDSKKELGSRVDRHEHIGQGKISNSAFKLLMQDETLKDIPKILETPKENEFLDDIKNIKKLQKLSEK